MKTNWKLIKTAPKDETDILVYWGDHLNKVVTARWSEPWEDWQTEITYGMPLPEAPTF
jgi:hypothetical protein